MSNQMQDRLEFCPECGGVILWDMDARVNYCDECEHTYEDERTSLRYQWQDYEGGR